MSLSTPMLEQYRLQIDELDQRLVQVLNRRAELTIDFLRLSGKAIPRANVHHQFTGEVLKQVAVRNSGPIPNTALEGIYREVIEGAFELARRTRVGYLGPFGTFSYQAAMQYFGDQVDFENLRTLQGVFEEVARGHVDFGLVPIENSTGGAVIESLDSFANYLGRLTIWGEVRLNIRFSLFGNGTLETITKVYSKAEALAQCYDWLTKQLPSAERVPYESTAAAVELAYLGDPADGIAAIGSVVAGQKYGLKPLAEGIETNPDNMTRFLILSRTAPPKTSHDKTSLMFTCSDRPGSLVDILSVFKRSQINLSHIEKRPSREYGSDFTFFVDMLGHAGDGRIAEILGEVRAHCRSLIVLGSFPVFDPLIRYQAQKRFTPAETSEALLAETKQIDDELIDLINQRAKLVIQVGEFKRQVDSPIYAPHRESAVLTKIQHLNRGPLNDRTLEGIYRELMSGSFRLEKPLRIGFLGPAGEFDHLAALRQFGSSVDFVSIRENRQVFQKVVAGEIDYGLVPIENTSLGGIALSLDAFFEFHHLLNIYGEVKLEIHYGLIADCKPEAIRHIYATGAVFEMCRNWLSTQYPHVSRMTVESTDRAIERVLEEYANDSQAGAAAIGSPLAGLQAGIRPLFEAIEDRPGNITRYLILSRSRTEKSGNDKTSIMFTTEDQPGALVDVLDVFKLNAINLTHLEKRPSGKTPWDYTFFVDLEGHRDDPRIGAVIGEARAHCKSLTVLGSFPACQRVL